MWQTVNTPLNSQDLKVYAIFRRFSIAKREKVKGFQFTKALDLIFEFWSNPHLIAHLFSTLKFLLMDRIYRTHHFRTWVIAICHIAPLSFHRLFCKNSRVLKWCRTFLCVSLRHTLPSQWPERNNLSPTLLGFTTFLTSEFLMAGNATHAHIVDTKWRNSPH